MTEETRPGFLANYEIVRPGPTWPAQVRPGPAGRAGPQFKNSARPGPLRPGPVDTYILNVSFFNKLLHVFLKLLC